MAAQLDYSYDTPKGVPGGIYDLSFSDIVTRMNGEADGVMGYGRAVVEGSSPADDVRLPDAQQARNVVAGITAALPNTEQDTGGRLSIAGGRPLSIMTKGRIWAGVGPGFVQKYSRDAYLIMDGEYRGCLTNEAKGYSIWEPCSAETEGAVEIVEEGQDGEHADGKITASKLDHVAEGYEPKVGDYIVTRIIYAKPTKLSGIEFTGVSDPENGIAVVEIGK